MRLITRVRLIVVSLALLAAPSSAVAAKPAPAPGKVGPAITGVAEQGRTVTVSTGDWKPRPSAYAYQWQRCDAAGARCADIDGATAADRTLTLDDAGATLRAVVTATGIGGSGSQTSAPTARIAGLRPALLDAPVLSGTPRVGRRLTVSAGEWANRPTAFAYAWERCETAACTPIAGAEASSYAPVAADVGSRLRSRVTATSEWGSAQATSAQSEQVAAAPATGMGEIVYAVGYRMYRVDPADGSRIDVPIADPPGLREIKASAPTLSPDGKDIIFNFSAYDYCCDPRGVAKVSADGGVPVVHFTTGGGGYHYQNPRYSPDGTRYLWRYPDLTIMESDAATGTVLGERGRSTGSQMAWSSDGEHVAHDRYYDFDWTSWIWVDGENFVPNSWATARYGMSGLDWAGDRFAFSRTGTIFLLRDDGAEPPVSTGLAGEWPTFSPDGTRLAYLAGNDLYVAPVDGRSAPVRLTKTGDVAGPLDWAGGSPGP